LKELLLPLLCLLGQSPCPGTQQQQRLHKRPALTPLRITTTMVQIRDEVEEVRHISRLLTHKSTRDVGSTKVVAIKRPHVAVRRKNEEATGRVGDAVCAM